MLLLVAGCGVGRVRLERMKSRTSTPTQLKRDGYEGLYCLSLRLHRQVREPNGMVLSAGEGSWNNEEGLLKLGKEYIHVVGDSRISISCTNSKVHDWAAQPRPFCFRSLE